MSNGLFPKKSDADDHSPKAGRIYFSRTSERKLFFFLTLAMLIMGILIKLGLW